MLRSLKLDGVGPAPEIELELAPRLNLLTGDNGLGKTFILDVAWWALTRTWADQPAWPHRGAGASPAIRYRIDNGKRTEYAAHFDFSAQQWQVAGASPAPGLVIYARVDGSFSVWDPARNASSVPALARAARRAAVAARAKGIAGPTGIAVLRPRGGSITQGPRGSSTVSRGGRGTSITRGPRGGGTVSRGGRGPGIRAPQVHAEASDHAPRPPAYHFSPSTLWNGLMDGERTLCSGLVRDWVLWQLQGSEAFGQLCHVLQALSPDEREPLEPGPPTRVSLDDVRDIPTLEMPYGTVPIVHASAGAKRVLGLAYLLVWAWQEHVRAAALLNQEATGEIILLVDEIEAHLHPQWQRAILPALLSVASGFGAGMNVQMLVTTHSPLVLASAEPSFDVEKDDLFHLDLEGDRVVVEQGGWAKQGDALNWLVSEVFGLRQARSREAERAIDAANAYMSGERAGLPPGLRTQKAIHAELLRLLPGHDPFWPRWIVSVERHPKRPRKL